MTTWQAYNVVGRLQPLRGPVRRPAELGGQLRPALRTASVGMNDFRTAVVPIVVRAERSGVPLSYFTNVDLHDDADGSAGARGLVSMGHDEYWTTGMRRHVVAARDAGTNLAFLGANTMYWRVRLDDRATGPLRLMTGYRDDASPGPAARRRPRPRRPPATATRRPPGPRTTSSGCSTSATRSTPTTWSSPRLVGLRGDRRPARHGDPGPRRRRVRPGLPERPHALARCRSSATPRSRCRGDATTTQSVYYTVALRCRGVHRRHPALGLRPRRPVRPAARHPDPRLRPAGHRRTCCTVSPTGPVGAAAPRPRQRRCLRPAAGQHGVGELSRVGRRRRVGHDGRHAWPPRGPGAAGRAAYAALALLGCAAVVVAASLAGCTDEPTTPARRSRRASPSSSPSVRVRPASTPDGATTSRPPSATRSPAYVVEAFLGDYPRDDFVRSLDAFTSGAAQSAAARPRDPHRRRLRGRAGGRGTTAGRPASPLRPRAARSSGVSAAVDFGFDVTDDGGDRDRSTLTGRLMLVPEWTAWRIFGYDVTRDDGRRRGGVVSAVRRVVGDARRAGLAAPARARRGTAAPTADQPGRGRERPGRRLRRRRRLGAGPRLRRPAGTPSAGQRRRDRAGRAGPRDRARGGHRHPPRLVGRGAAATGPAEDQRRPRGGRTGRSWRARWRS